ncbi:hypothetical protein TIFTF001_003788 [Ficus carica]|uniref:Uncharacterized protein n=1 Tax=Ficus carica TaxID=3494 RepID=A0AA88CWL6_FICCA|nr:hypothetical protein TIFTF001_003788 [Ficus carica]
MGTKYANLRGHDEFKNKIEQLETVQHLVALKNGTITNKEQDHELHVQLPNGQKPVSLSALEDGQITPNSVLDSPIFLSGSTTGSFSGGGENNICTTALVSFTAATECVKKKIKGVPQRSP